MDLQIELLPNYGDQQPPAYATEGSSGFDLRAILREDSMVLGPQARVLVPTGIKVIIPEGYEGQIRPRSGLAWRNGITVLNTPGTIDADFRGEIQVILANLSYVNKYIYFGDRIAQFVLAPVCRPTISLIKKVEADTQRGEDGFGSTGEQ